MATQHQTIWQDQTLLSAIRSGTKTCASTLTHPIPPRPPKIQRQAHTCKPPLGALALAYALLSNCVVPKGPYWPQIASSRKAAPSEGIEHVSENHYRHWYKLRVGRMRGALATKIICKNPMWSWVFCCILTLSTTPPRETVMKSATSAPTIPHYWQ
jgi:hypothetical protein